MRDLDESHPVWKVIHRAASQTCDIAAIFRDLDAAGFEIVRKVDVDPANLWDRYRVETPLKQHSPQGALAFGVHAVLEAQGLTEGS